jgi:hypothetical protein
MRAAGALRHAHPSAVMRGAVARQWVLRAGPMIGGSHRCRSLQAIGATTCAVELFDGTSSPTPAVEQLLGPPRHFAGFWRGQAKGGRNMAEQHG